MVRLLAQVLINANYFTKQDGKSIMSTFYCHTIVIVVSNTVRTPRSL